MLRERAIEHERRVRERFPGATGPIRAARHMHEEAADRDAAADPREPRDAPACGVPLPIDGAIAIPDLLYWEDEGLVVHAARLATRLQNTTRSAPSSRTKRS
jgi:hypothetical protein